MSKINSLNINYNFISISYYVAQLSFAFLQLWNKKIQIQFIINKEIRMFNLQRSFYFGQGCWLRSRRQIVNGPNFRSARVRQSPRHVWIQVASGLIRRVRLRKVRQRKTFCPPDPREIRRNQANKFDLAE